MIFFLFFIQSLFAQECHYSYTIWNANLKKSFGYQCSEGDIQINNRNLLIMFLIGFVGSLFAGFAEPQRLRHTSLITTPQAAQSGDRWCP
jgi:hypothetical protein